jgi:ketosteroid isomerase-like protein
MPGRDPEAPPQLGLGSPVEGAVEDQLHASADQLRARPPDTLRPPVGPAAKTRPVARRLGRSGQREPPDILGTRPRRTARPAVDARCDDRREGFHTVTYTGPPGSRPVTFGPPLAAVRIRREGSTRFAHPLGLGNSKRRTTISERTLEAVATFHELNAHYIRNGSPGSTRYTDIWHFRDGRWQAVAAQLTSVARP